MSYDEFEIEELNAEPEDDESGLETDLCLNPDELTIRGEARTVFGEDDVAFLNRVERVDGFYRASSGMNDQDASRCWFRQFAKRMGSSPIEMQCKRCYREKRKKPIRGCGYMLMSNRG